MVSFVVGVKKNKRKNSNHK